MKSYDVNKLDLSSQTTFDRYLRLLNGKLYTYYIIIIILMLLVIPLSYVIIVNCSNSLYLTILIFLIFLLVWGIMITKLLFDVIKIHNEITSTKRNYKSKFKERANV